MVRGIIVRGALREIAVPKRSDGTPLVGLLNLVLDTSNGERTATQRIGVEQYDRLGVPTAVFDALRHCAVGDELEVLCTLRTSEGSKYANLDAVHVDNVNHLLAGKDVPRTAPPAAVAAKG